MHGLERLVQDKNAAGEHFAATAHAGRLVELDPLSEVYGRHLVRSLLLAGDRSSAERHHAALTQRLRDELGVAPEAATEALINPTTAPPVHAVPATLGSGKDTYIRTALKDHAHGTPRIGVPTLRNRPIAARRKCAGTTWKRLRKRAHQLCV